MKAFLAILILVLSTHASAKKHATQSELNLESIDLATNHLTVGCAMSEINKPHRYILFADPGSSGLVVVDGKKKTLSLLQGYSDNLKAGDPVNEAYSADKLKLNFAGSFIKNCPQEGPPCRQAEGKLAVSIGKNKKSYDVIIECGKFPDR